ncbi:MAG: epoxyqueuosine reductase QueH [Alphaproteobacteria bacterium]|nr:MAG: hypothetical protein B6I23_01590 [Rickettsiaceae bacterium 4572_127]
MQKNSFQDFLPEIKTSKLLLHTCCSPCAVEAVEKITSNDISLQLYFYNPNITDPIEYEKRLKEVKKLADFFKIPLFIDEFNPADFLCEIKGLEAEPEKGDRCAKCFLMRLSRMRNFAEKHKINFTTSVLGVSRWKDFDQTARAGMEAFLSANGTEYLPINWRKNNSEPRRLSLIKEQKIYQQNYCGCPFSKK